ncbi:glycosyltransferase involved in cell wall biosynthesis [Salinibacter ruber]|uniref:glycosyltransferase family 2 protein n=1 Tax=Salinibacter ruber TaxID=146919 RepID=UPI00207483CC|nr:glycosyltransferase [Salinibacter ruber]MCS3672013.1 glycosyltransferase involved in cell wall biosynthesis [Salinibacter ruber]
MSVHNGADYLESALESILNQTYMNFEFLITDDCSTDESPAIIQRYAERDDRIRSFRNKENQGLTKSLNDMLQRAEGELIARMDADDVSRPDRFERQLSAFEEEPIPDLVFSNTRLIDKNGAPICISWRPSEEQIVDQIGERCYIPHPTVMARTEAIRKVGGYNENYWTGQDHELWERLKTDGAVFRYSPDVLLDYRLNPDSVRAESSDDYWFKVSNWCIWNRRKLRSLRYIDRLTWFQRATIIAKLFVPHALMIRRG